MQKVYIYTLMACLVCSSFVANAQQDPIYAMYLNNPMIINPAFAGSNNMFNAAVQYRTQWAGLDGNPRTLNFNTNMSVYQNRVGVGIQLIQDRLGDAKNTEFNSLFAYKLRLQNNTTFSFGMQFGFIRYTTDPSLLSLKDQDDPAFVALSETKFNTGAGLMLKNDRFVLGLSVPRMLSTTLSTGGTSVLLYNQNYYLFGSYVFFLSEKVRFKPSVLLRGTKGSPLSADVNASFNFREYYTVGLFTRNLKTYGLLAQVIVQNFRIGYVFELPGSKDSSLNFTSHEVTLGFSTALLRGHDKVIKTF